MQLWHGWLAKVLDHLVDSASGSPSLPFWDTIIKHNRGGSGGGHFAGWMTTFNVFSSEGYWQAYTTELHDYIPGRGSVYEQCEYPVLGPESFSKGMCKVPVLVCSTSRDAWFKCFMFSGSFRSEIRGKNTMMPVNDWCIATTMEETKPWPAPNPERPNPPAQPTKPASSSNPKTTTKPTAKSKPAGNDMFSRLRK